MISRLPKSYSRAWWRCVSSVDQDTCRVGLGFNLENGEVLRISVPASDAMRIAESITYFVQCYLDDPFGKARVHDPIQSQSAKSSGNPSADVSMEPNS